MSSRDDTRRLLEEMLAHLHTRQARESPSSAEAYLRAKDGQFLGTVSSNIFERDSLLNKYGPYGSRYSPTSIFNKYSKYGSRYGVYSVNNPLSTSPPQLIVNERVVASITANPRISSRIPLERFVATLETDPELLLQGRTVSDAQAQERLSHRAYIEAEDGTFLGKLNSNEIDSDSIFNPYGSFGSEYSPTSIFNMYSSYGGKYALQSPFNEYSSTPPKIFLNGKFAGYLTLNTYVSPRIDPTSIKEWARRNVPAYG